MTRPAVFHPVLVAAYPILFLYGQNISTVPRSELPLPLALAVGVLTYAATLAGGWRLFPSQAARLLSGSTGPEPGGSGAP